MIWYDFLIHLHDPGSVYPHYEDVPPWNWTIPLVETGQSRFQVDVTYFGRCGEIDAITKILFLKSRKRQLNSFFKNSLLPPPTHLVMRNLCFGTPNYCYPCLGSEHRFSIGYALRHIAVNVSMNQTVVSYAFVPDFGVWEMRSCVALRFVDIGFYH